MTSARPCVAVACFVIGLLLVLLIEAGIARLIGVPLIFTGIVFGVPRSRRRSSSPATATPTEPRAVTDRIVGRKSAGVGISALL